MSSEQSKSRLWLWILPAYLWGFQVGRVQGRQEERLEQIRKMAEKIIDLDRRARREVV